MIRVALISHSPWLAGAERMLFNLAVLLKKTDLYEPVMFIPDGPSGDLKRECNANLIQVIEVSEYVQYIYVSKDTIDQNAEKTLASANYLRRILIDNQVEIIVNNTATSIAPVIAAIELQMPIIGWIHGVLDSYLLPYEFDASRRLFLDRMLIALSDIVLCCSDWTSNHYKKFEVTPIKTLYNWTPFPDEIMELNEDNNTFICLNTFDEYKGIFTLLEAGMILKKIDQDFTILFYGDGSTKIKDRIKRYIAENKLEKNIKLMGRTNNIASVYNNSFCLIQPSYIESFGMTIIEAMSYKRPVIATKSGGPQEIINDGVNGFLVERNNPEKLAEKMKLFLDDKKKAKEFGKKGRKIYDERFSPDKAKKDFLTILEDTFSNYKGVSIEKRLIYDSLRYVFEKEKSEPILYQEKNIPIQRYSKIINSEMLTLSKKINKSRRYNILCEIPQLSQIGVIFASKKSENYNGSVTMKIYARGRLLRKSLICLDSIKNNQWVYFQFDTIYGCGGKVLTIELEFIYSDNIVRLGVYEDKNNRDFIYKIFNKFGFPLKGMDVLFADFKM